MTTMTTITPTLSTDTYNITIADGTCTIYVHATHSTMNYRIISDDSPASNRLYVICEGATITATPYMLIVESGDRVLFSLTTTLSSLNQSFFVTDDGTRILFGVPNPYHVDAATTKVIIKRPSESEYMRYTSMQVKMLPDGCKFYTSSGTTIHLHRGAPEGLTENDWWDAVTINDVRHEIRSGVADSYIFVE